MEREEHIRLLGWLWIIRGGLLALGGVAAFIGCFFGGLFSGNLAETFITPIIGLAIALGLFLFALPSLAAGKGLLEGKSWARVLAMVLGALNFLEFPLGTALCVYTFWTLWGEEADYHFEGTRRLRYHDRY